jgi:hypothetical protein
MNNADLKEKLIKVIEILSAPEDSDEIWFCVGQLEDIVKELNSPTDDEICEACDNGTDWPCDDCLSDEDKAIKKAHLINNTTKEEN